MASPERTIAKDFMALMKSIKSFSDDQAEVTKWDDKNLGNFEVTISPNGGFYKEGEFVFEISMESCDDLPRLNCKTAIYHPNIDTIQDPDGEICINLFDVDMWSSDCSMQDVVQGLLFLMYNPNLDDPLCGAVNCSSMEEFGKEAETAIAGGRVGDYLFPVNPRYARLHPAAGQEKKDEEKEDENGEVRDSGKVGKEDMVDGGDERPKDGERTGLIEEGKDGDESKSIGADGGDERPKDGERTGLIEEGKDGDESESIGADGGDERPKDGERTGLIEELKDGDDGERTGSDGSKEDLEDKPEGNVYLEERYFGIKEYMHDYEERDDCCDEEEDEEVETDDSSLFSDLDDPDIINDDDTVVVHDEELFELFDRVDDSLVDDENRKNMDSTEGVVSWSKMIYGAGNKSYSTDRVQVLIQDLSTVENSSEGACKEAGNAAGPALTRIPQGIQRPTVTSRFYCALQTRTFRRWLV